MCEIHYRSPMRGGKKCTKCKSHLYTTEQRLINITPTKQLPIYF
jgi:hypothetical protein